MRPGGGNFSLRFYEALSCGRIPVFVDTDCVLPFHDTIDWRRYGVWCDQSELPDIADKVADFHARLDARAFATLQRSCRTLWEERLSALGFFSHLHRCVYPHQ